MDKNQLFNTQIVEGCFGLDDDYNHYIKGKICLDSSFGVRLILNDSFSDTIQETFREMQELVERPIIKGYGNNGKYYELINCVSIGGKLTFGGLVQPVVDYGCEYLIEYQGYQIKDKTFNKICFEIDKLNQWCNTELCAEMKTFEPPFNFELKNKTYWQKTQNGLTYSIANGFKTQGEDNVEFNVSFNYWLGIEYPPETINIANIQNYINTALDFKILLNLFTNEKSHINKITLIGGENHDYSANLYCYAVEQIKESIIDPHKRYGMIGLRAVQNNLFEIFNNYLIKKKSLSGTIHSVLSLSDIKKHRKVETINYVKQTSTAIEGFMRNSRRILIEENKNDFNARLDRILTNQTKEDEEWLRNKLKYANQASFRKQITKLFNEIKTKFPECAKDVLNVKKIKDDLIDRFVNTRNFYTHYDTETQGSMLGINTQVSLCDYINELLRLLVLMEIGVESDTITKLNKQNQLLIISKKNLLKNYMEENNGQIKNAK